MSVTFPFRLNKALSELSQNLKTFMILKPAAHEGQQLKTHCVHAGLAEFFFSQGREGEVSHVGGHSYLSPIAELHRSRFSFALIVAKFS